MTHLHATLVSYKRRGLTERTLESWLATVSVPYSLVIVDNGSPAEVTDWLHTLDIPVVFLDENKYPGYATNLGWSTMPPETTLLQRCDNDVNYLPNWCDEMLKAFENPRVGQFGPVAAGDEPWASQPDWPVGGNSIVRRELYDKGLRYSDLPWTEMPGEDTLFYRNVISMGYQRAFSATPCIEWIGDGDEEYHRETYQVRGLLK